MKNQPFSDPIKIKQLTTHYQAFQWKMHFLFDQWLNCKTQQSLTFYNATIFAHTATSSCTSNDKKEPSGKSSSKTLDYSVEAVYFL